MTSSLVLNLATAPTTSLSGVATTMDQYVLTTLMGRYTACFTSVVTLLSRIISYRYVVVPCPPLVISRAMVIMEGFFAFLETRSSDVPGTGSRVPPPPSRTASIAESTIRCFEIVRRDFSKRIRTPDCPEGFFSKTGSCSATAQPLDRREDIGS